MAAREDIEDRKLSLKLFAGIASILIVVGLVLIFLVGPTIAATFAPGIDLRMAAVIAFILSLVIIVIMAVAAGDGLLGELQYMLLGFAGFFIVCWLMIAWIF